MRKWNKQKITLGLLLVLLSFVGIITIPANFEIVSNYSDSLPYRFVIIKKGVLPSKKGQAFVFYVRDNGLLGVDKIKFIKLVGGLPGDEVKVRGGEVYFGASILKENMFYKASLSKLMNDEEFDNGSIKIIDKEVYVSNKRIGVAKAYSKKIENIINNKIDGFDEKKYRLSVIDSGIIPPRKFFAYTPHKDSFDSRYKEIGLIDEKDIVGTAIFTF